MASGDFGIGEGLVLPGDFSKGTEVISKYLEDLRKELKSLEDMNIDSFPNARLLVKKEIGRLSHLILTKGSGRNEVHR